jgi:signal transduction histidine kinase
MKHSLTVVSQNSRGSGLPDELRSGDLNIDQRDEFLAMINHELRTPLASLMGALSLLKFQDSAKADPEIFELIDLADRSGRRLERLVDDFLDFTQLEGNRLFINFEPCDLLELLQDTVKICAVHRSDLELVLETKLKDGLRLASVDRHRFGQVINNLLTNAIKYSETKKQVFIELDLRETCGAKFLDIKIRDQGPGISPEDLAKMFQKLSPVRTPGASTLSTHGLGLFITTALVKALNGELNITSELGTGTEITVSFFQLHSNQQSSAQSASTEAATHA